MFDVIGDIHGCYDEFVELTKKLGYEWNVRNDGNSSDASYSGNLGFPIHPDGRQLAFVGDLTDRGPESIKVMEIVYKLVVEEKMAHYTPGNHCDKLYRYFLGRNVQIKHGLETTVAEYNDLSSKEQAKVRSHFMKLFEKAPLYLTLDHGKLVIAHAGIRQDYIGKTSNKVKTFVLYGDITGETNPDGTPVRRDWATQYEGEAWIVYGHTPVEKPRNINKTWNIDTGCVFGGMLTALRYPEMETVSVQSKMERVPEKFRAFAD